MAICGCQPGVLSNIEYRDIELAVMRDLMNHTKTNLVEDSS
jgi:hypothetical protein